MNNPASRKGSIGFAAIWLAALPLAGAEVQLAVVQFPERSSIDLKMLATNRVAPAEAEASVKFKEGQARVEVEYKKLPPAILFGGDVTSYVVWAVARDGNAENLGELIVRDPKGSGEYRTGQKEFALMVTAEPYPLVLKPHDLVVFTSVAPPLKKVRSAPITYSSFEPTPRVGNAQIGAMSFSGSEPLEIVQAQAVLIQAQQMGADKYAPDALREASVTLAQATNFFNAGKTKQGVDYARRSLSLSSTAIRDTQRKLAEEAAAATAARRAAEMQALEQQRTSAEQQAAAAERQALAAREQALAAREQAAAAQQQLTSLQQQAEQAQRDAYAAQERAATAGLSAEAAEAARRDADDARRRAEALAAQAQSAKADAERKTEEVASAAAALETQRKQLQAENERLSKEREDLSAQLNGALSSVAQIKQTARGIVVSLPDILFDVNKATLKQNTQVALGKLAGIVSLFPNINLRIEGYTDSTGTDEINNRLSRERAGAVMMFLRQQGVAERRMSVEGYGSKFPVADNSTPEGRARNRRVEIVLAEGVIQGAGQ